MRRPSGDGAAPRRGTSLAASSDMRKLQTCLSAASAIAVAIVLGAGCTAESSLHVVNNSDFEIDELYLTDVGNRDWGPNLLGNDPLRVGEDLVIDVPCGYYDALLVDEQGVGCELDNLDLCLNDARWEIRNNTCTVFGARQAPGDAPAAPAPAPQAGAAR